jgi:hypothetical protein
MAQAVDELILEMQLQNKQVIKALKDVNKRIKGTEKQVKKTNKENQKALKRQGKDWLGLLGRITGFSLAAKKALDFKKEFDEYKQGFDALERASNGNAQKIIDKLKEVSAGTIANKDIMLSANRAIALNVTRDVGEMAKLLEVARVRGKAMGLDTTQAFNDLVTGIGRGSPMILDNLGIITKGWDEEAKAAGKSLDQQFILNKILKQSEVALKKTGATTLTAAERTQRFTATMKNMGLIVGKAFSNVITPFQIGLQKLADVFTKLPSGIQEVVVGVGTLSTALGLAVKFLGLSVSTAGALGIALIGVATAYKLTMAAIDSATRSQRGWLAVTSETDLKKAQKDLESYKNEYKELTGVQFESVQATKDFTKALVDNNEQIIQLGEDYRAGKITLEEYNKEAGKISQELSEQGTQWALLGQKIINTTKSVELFQETRKKQQELDNQLHLEELNNLNKSDEAAENKHIKQLQRLEALTEATNMQRENELIAQQLDLEKRLALLKQEKELFLGTEQEFNLQKELLEQQLQENLNAQRELTLERDIHRQQIAEEVFGTTMENLTLKNQAEVEKIRLAQEKLWQRVKEEAKRGTDIIVDDYSTGISKMIVSGEKFSKSFGDFIQDLIIQVGELIIKLLVAEGIKTGLDIATGGVSGLLGFAEGTDSAPGGPAVVGEKGPELMFVPKGAKIVPNHKIGNVSRFTRLPSFANGTGSNTTIDSSNNSNAMNVNNLNLNDISDPMSFIMKLNDFSERRLGVKLFNI